MKKINEKIRKVIGAPFLFLGQLLLFIGISIYGKTSLRDMAEIVGIDPNTAEKMSDDVAMERRRKRGETQFIVPMDEEAEAIAEVVKENDEQGKDTRFFDL